MSGLVSGIGKVFSTVGRGVARVSQAVIGAGATAFTGGAAAGSVAGAAQAAGRSTLGSILGGVIKQAGVGALIGGGISAITGNGFGKGALIGGLTGGGMGLFQASGLGGPQGISGNFPPAPSAPGLVTADTPTGVAPTGSTAAPVTGIPGVDAAGAGATASAPQPAPMSGFRQFLTSETGGRVIAGLGQGLGQYMKAKQEEEEAQKDRDFVLAREQRVRDSYRVDPNSLPGNPSAAPDSVARPTPARKWLRRRPEYDAGSGQIVWVNA